VTWLFSLWPTPHAIAYIFSIPPAFNLFFNAKHSTQKHLWVSLWILSRVASLIPVVQEAVILVEESDHYRKRYWVGRPPGLTSWEVVMAGDPRRVRHSSYSSRRFHASIP
jgi:hypothetical protein